MVVTQSFQGKVIAIDTAPFIYFIEEHPDFGPPIAQLFEQLDRGEFKAVTSTITLLEVPSIRCARINPRSPNATGRFCSRPRI